MADLLAGNINLVFDCIATAGQQHKSGAAQRVRWIAAVPAMNIKIE